MKSVMISIKPKWCELIASGKKTVEVRKTRPKIETPFKCYIYETKGKTEVPTFIDEEGHEIYEGRGQVIGWFICNEIKEVYANNGVQTYYNGSEGTCLSDYELIKYASGKKIYYWHISDLVIYDKPKDLCDFMAFGKDCCDRKNCEKCLYLGIDNVCDIENIEQPLFRPPQSWGYVEEVEQ